MPAPPGACGHGPDPKEGALIFPVRTREVRGLVPCVAGELVSNFPVPPPTNCVCLNGCRAQEAAQISGSESAWQALPPLCCPRGSAALFDDEVG